MKQKPVQSERLNVYLTECLFGLTKDVEGHGRKRTSKKGNSLLIALLFERVRRK